MWSDTRADSLDLRIYLSSTGPTLSKRMANVAFIRTAALCEPRSEGDKKTLMPRRGGSKSQVVEEPVE